MTYVLHDAISHRGEVLRLRIESKNNVFVIFSRFQILQCHTPTNRLPSTVTMELKHASSTRISIAPIWWTPPGIKSFILGRPHISAILYNWRGETYSVVHVRFHNQMHSRLTTWLFIPVDHGALKLMLGICFYRNNAVRCVGWVWSNESISDSLLLHSTGWSG